MNEQSTASATKPEETPLTLESFPEKVLRRYRDPDGVIRFSPERIREIEELCKKPPK